MAFKKPKHELRNKTVVIRVTSEEKQRYNIAKDRLLNSSPPLSAHKIIYYCIQQVDDYALIEFLRLAKDDPIRMKLHNDYIFSRLANKDKNR